MSVVSADPHADRPGFRAWLLVALLMLAYASSFIDRQIFTLLIDPIKHDLKVSDTAVSLLAGLAFTLLYTGAALPLAVVIDRTSRTSVIRMGVFSWSLMTVACGLARNFIQLFLARMGVGLGEAVLSPATHALIAETFPPRLLGPAMSLFVLGAVLGQGGGYLFGGAVVQFVNAGGAQLHLLGLSSWHGAFVIVGLTGLPLTLLLLLVREPKRIAVAVTAAQAPAAKPFRDWPHWRFFGLTVAGATAVNTWQVGLLSWLPTYFVRAHHWPVEKIASLLGFGFLGFGIAGVAFGGGMSAWLRARNILGGNTLLPALAWIVALPLAIAFPLVASRATAAALMFPLIFLICVPLALIPAAIQEIAPPTARAKLSASYMFVVNSIGAGMGATVVALMTDFVFRDPGKVGYSLAASAAILLPIGVVCFLLATRQARTFGASSPIAAPGLGQPLAKPGV